MPTNKRIRRFSSDGDIAVSLPTGWGALTQSDLRVIVRLFHIWNGDPDADVRIRVFAFLHFIRARVLRRLSDGAWLCRFFGDRHDVFSISSEGVSSFIARLDWLLHPEFMTVRLESMGGGVAVDMFLHGVPFFNYLTLENYYQAFLLSPSPDVLHRMASILYPGCSDDAPLSGYELTAVQMWYVAVKWRLSETFTNFFRPSGGGAPVTRQSLTDGMNAQIRALTQGDVTRESAIQNIDTWRALTELDALAREAREFELKYGKK